MGCCELSQKGCSKWRGREKTVGALELEKHCAERAARLVPRPRRLEGCAATGPFRVEGTKERPARQADRVLAHLLWSAPLRPAVAGLQRLAGSPTLGPSPVPFL